MQRGGMATLDSKPVRSHVEGEVAHLQRILMEQQEEKQLEIDALRETLNQIVTRHAEELQAVNSGWEGAVAALRQEGDGEVKRGGAYSAKLKDHSIFAKKLAVRAAAAALAVDRMNSGPAFDASYPAKLAAEVRCPHCGGDITDTRREADERETCTSSEEREERRVRVQEVRGVEGPDERSRGRSRRRSRRRSKALGHNSSSGSFRGSSNDSSRRCSSSSRSSSGSRREESQALREQVDELSRELERVQSQLCITRRRLTDAMVRLQVSRTTDATSSLTSIDAPPAALASRGVNGASLCDLGWSPNSTMKDLPDGVARLSGAGHCADGARHANEAWLLELFVSQVHRVAECMEAYCGKVARRLSRQGFRTDHLVLEMVGGRAANHADDGGAGSDAESCHSFQHSRRRGRHRSECASLLDSVLNIASCVLFTDFEAEDFVRGGFSRLLSNDERCAVKLAKFLSLKEKDRVLRGALDANREAKFAQFCARRLEEMGEWLQAAALAGGRELPDERMSTALLGDEGDEFASASADFICLCRAVLSLHEAAWSFRCPLRISRIPPNVVFDSALMRPYTWTDATAPVAEPGLSASAGFSAAANLFGTVGSAKNGGSGSCGSESGVLVTSQLVPAFLTTHLVVQGVVVTRKPIQ